MSRSFSIEANNSGETRSSASRLKIQSWLAASTANCFCAAKPGHELMITRAPQAAAISRVASVDSESITRTSSAQATDSHAARIFSASLKVMIVAEIFILECAGRAERRRRFGFACLITQFDNPKRRRRSALPAHSKGSLRLDRILNHDAVDSKGRGRCPLQVGERFIVISLRLQLVSTRRGEFVLSLQQQECSRASNFVKLLLAG